MAFQCQLLLPSPQAYTSRHTVRSPFTDLREFVVARQAPHRNYRNVSLSAKPRCSDGDRNSQVERAGADELLALLRSKRQGPCSGPGQVHLVGTGPGDPDLLTLQALRLMQTADVVLYDRLVSPEILRMVHPGARLVYVGKQQGFHTRTQDEIHELLCQFAEDGSCVLRLKGGDPYVFGRGGEEVQHLSSRGINTTVVPGITAASGISAELGVPLTHRGVATSVRFLTGHSREGGEEDLDATISASADPHTTLVVYMGLNTLPALAQQLIHKGLRPDVPAVAVERGTTPAQRQVFAPLQRLQEAVALHQLVSPTLLIIGEVVALSPGWQHYMETGVDLQGPGCIQHRPVVLSTARSLQDVV